MLIKFPPPFTTRNPVELVVPLVYKSYSRRREVTLAVTAVPRAEEICNVL